MNLVLKSSLIAIAMAIVCIITSQAKIDMRPLKDITGSLREGTKNTVNKRYGLSHEMVKLIVLCFVQQTDLVNEYRPLNITAYSIPIRKDMDNAFKSIFDSLYNEVKRCNRGTALIKDIDFAVKYVEDSCALLADKGEVALMEWRLAMKRNGIPWIWHSIDDLQILHTKNTTSPFTPKGLFGIDWTDDGAVVMRDTKVCEIRDQPREEELRKAEMVEAEMAERFKQRKLEYQNAAASPVESVNVTTAEENVNTQNITSSEDNTGEELR